MNAFEVFLTKPFFQHLGWTLLNFVWQGALIAALHGGLMILLRRSSANVRYLFSCAALLLMVSFPLIGTLGESSFYKDSTANENLLKPEGTVAEPLQRSETQSNVNAVSIRPNEHPAPENSTVSLPHFRLSKGWAQEQLTFFMPWLAAIWLAGVSFLSLRLIGEIITTRQLKQAEISPFIQVWQDKLQSLARRLEVSQTVRLYQTAKVEVPTVVGWLKPVILIPVSAITCMNPQHLEALLAHELAHIRRYDFLINLVQIVAETLLFYHPAVWYVSNRIRQEREYCCDDLAVTACGDVLLYSNALFELEKLRCATPQFTVAASGGSLLRRIQRLVIISDAPRTHFSPMAAALIGVLILLSLLNPRQTTFLTGQARNTESEAEQAETKRVKVDGPLSLNPAKAATNRVDNNVDNKVAAQASGQPETMPAADSSDAQSGENQAGRDAGASEEDLLPGLAAEGYTNLSTDQINKLRINGISLKFIREMKAAIKKDLSINDLIGLNSLGISANDVSEFKRLGYASLSVAELNSIAINGITPDYIIELTSLGYDSLPLDLLLAFKQQSITPGFIREMKDLIGSRISAQELIRLKAEGITAKLIKEFKALGYSALSLDQLFAFRANGVSPSFIKSIQPDYAGLPADELINLRRHGITPEFIAKLNSHATNPISIDQLVVLWNEGNKINSSAH